MQRSNIINDLNRNFQERALPAIAEVPHSNVRNAALELDLLQRNLPKSVINQLLVEAIRSARLTYPAPAITLGTVISYYGNVSQASSDHDNNYAYKDNISIAENYGFLLHNQIDLENVQPKPIMGLLTGILAAAKRIIGSPTGGMFSSNVATSAERLAAEAVVESVMDIQSIIQNGQWLADKLITEYIQESYRFTSEIFTSEATKRLEQGYQSKLTEQLSEKNNELAELKQKISEYERKLFQLEMNLKSQKDLYEERLKSKDMEKQAEMKQKELAEQYASRIYEQLDTNLNAIRESLVSDGRASHRTSVSTGIASNIVVQRKQEGMIQHSWPTDKELNKAFTLQRNKVLVFLASKIVNGDARFELYYNRVRTSLEEPLESMDLQGLAELLAPAEKELLSIIADETAAVLRDRIQQVNSVTPVFQYMRKKLSIFEQQLNLFVDLENTTSKLSQ